MNKATEPTIHHLMNIPKFGEGIGLHRMQWLLERIGSEFPTVAFDAIKIVGSNGKGSTASILNSIFYQLGETFGLNTSPHLYRFNERIKIGLTDISDNDLTEALQWYYRQQERFTQLFPNDRIGAFEAFTAMALYYYAKQNIPNLIVEAGIGGRYDSTRVVPGKLAALTALDLEHTSLLGNTLELIAYDKIDICEPGSTLVLGKVDNQLMPRIKNYCRMKEVRLIPVEDYCHTHFSGYRGDTMIMDLDMGEFHLKDLTVNLAGPHQIDNVATAVVLFNQWLTQHRPGISREQFISAIEKGLENVVWPGRCKKIHTSPDIYIDVGHSPGAVESYVNTMKEMLRDCNKKILLVTGVSYDKDVEGNLIQLLTIADAAICTRAYHKGSEVSVIDGLVKKIKPEIPRYPAGTMEEAMKMAVDVARKEDMIVMVGGGLFLSIEAQYALEGKDPQSLHFF